ncbi:hypothetical protein NQX30_00425 [Candidatus Persebacteraceae bacterium Df01]|uniref:Secreted protein n=1 Tax=Candidatus Doriopsillibacter californiensis TaxID=2970740 RepID=A0ABT7QJJ2_9GAMM|nr:hypothetical protein [Candidatus Persebacteraceae bacterium Df01]
MESRVSNNIWRLLCVANSASARDSPAPRKPLMRWRLPVAGNDGNEAADESARWLRI